MSSGIQPLPTDVIHLIAAGEVIDSLAAVVRELAENALDAGATRITLSLWPSQWRLRLADNGQGMDWADLAQAAQAHSTSKIRDRSGLLQVATLGFRGEALHSLAQMGDLEILSCGSELEGFQVMFDALGEVVQSKPRALAQGTIVEIRDLFGRWAARRDRLPPMAQQLRSVQQMVQQLALGHPEVTWIVQQDDRSWFELSGGGMAQVVAQVLPNVQRGDLAVVRTGELELVLGLPDRVSRHRPDWVRVLVNGRQVRLPELEQGILGLLRRALPRDRFPIAVVHLHVPPDQVDWNRHPAKAELYLQGLEQWPDRIAAAIEQALSTIEDPGESSRTQQILRVAEASAGYGLDRTITPPEETPLLELRALAQVHDMYIMAEHPSGMWLVEQHIAHERVLYEQIRSRWSPVVVEPPVLLEGLKPAQVEQLERVGLAIDPFGESLWAVRSLPELLVGRSDQVAALVELSLAGDLQGAQVAVACRSAIRNGVRLSMVEMQDLLDAWQGTKNPRTCPHGRPIFLRLEESSLSKYFRRSWVVGKSHGI
jgi:DNA mismatch repair protein MutL